MEPISTPAAPVRKPPVILLSIIVLILIILGGLYYYFHYRPARPQAPAGTSVPVVSTASSTLMQQAATGKLSDPALKLFILPKDAVITDSSINNVTANNTIYTSSVVYFTTQAAILSVYKEYLTMLPNLGYGVARTEASDPSHNVITIHASGQNQSSVVVTIDSVSASTTKVGVFMNRPTTQ